MSYNCPKCGSSKFTLMRDTTGYVNICDACGVGYVADIARDPAPAVSVKYDSEKPAVQYIPMEALFTMGEAYGYGAKKYGGYNFQLTGLEVTRCLAAAVRHIFQFLAGEDNDKESGKSHLGHAMAAIGMAVYSLHHHPSKDDRFKRQPNDKT